MSTPTRILRTTLLVTSAMWMMRSPIARAQYGGECIKQFYTENATSCFLCCPQQPYVDCLIITVEDASQGVYSSFPVPQTAEEAHVTVANAQHRRHTSSRCKTQSAVCHQGRVHVMEVLVALALFAFPITSVAHVLPTGRLVRTIPIVVLVCATDSPVNALVASLTILLVIRIPTVAAETARTGYVKTIAEPQGTPASLTLTAAHIAVPTDIVISRWLAAA